MHVRKGMVLVGDDGQLYHVVDRDLNTPGNLRSILQLRLRSLKTGNVTTRRFHPEDKAEQAALDKREMQYVYQDGDGYVFMDTETFDQTTLPRDWAAEFMLFLREQARAHVVFHDGRPLSIDLPATVELAVADADPYVRGANAAPQAKQVTLETGLKLSVPAFVEPGEVIAVDTRTTKYLGRAAK
jgi:elongation factor P